MIRTIPECDWRAFKRIQERAQDRACQAALAKAGRTIADQSKSAHDRFRTLCRFLKSEEKAFDQGLTEYRRSAVIETLLIMDRRELLTDEDLAELTAETRQLVLTFRGAA